MNTVVALVDNFQVLSSIYAMITERCTAGNKSARLAFLTAERTETLTSQL